ncbi:TPA: (2Fe-2S) ferredoxin domain-containing protein [Candidatus Woesearchaeota archaeon]|nr:(2Fe-2S) ferredoxin domain-containing protein [Candidatus Woesearchaeota archaeon]
MEEIKFPKPKIHLFVCVNDRTKSNNPTPSCGPRIKPEDVKKVKEWIHSEGLTTEVYCTKAQCLGFCNPEGSVAVIYPKGKFIKGIQTKDDLKQLLREEMSSSQL